MTPQTDNTYSDSGTRHPTAGGRITRPSQSEVVASRKNASEVTRRSWIGAEKSPQAPATACQPGAADKPVTWGTSDGALIWARRRATRVGKSETMGRKWF